MEIAMKSVPKPMGASTMARNKARGTVPSAGSSPNKGAGGMGFGMKKGGAVKKACGGSMKMKCGGKVK